MTESWTPGPWAVDTIHENGFYLQDARGYELHDGRTEANRRLIAAAPEMAEWIAAMVAEAERYVERMEKFVGPITLPDTQLEKGRALLSRIRGEA